MKAWLITFRLVSLGATLLLLVAINGGVRFENVSFMFCAGWILGLFAGSWLTEYLMGLLCKIKARR